MTPARFLLAWAAFIVAGWLIFAAIVTMASFIITHAGWGTFGAALAVTAALVGCVYVAGEK